MGCGCNKNKSNFEVVTADGKVVPGSYSTQGVADAVAKRYPGAKVRPVGSATKATQAPATSKKTPAK